MNIIKIHICLELYLLRTDKIRYDGPICSNRVGTELKKGIIYR